MDLITIKPIKEIVCREFIASPQLINDLEINSASESLYKENDVCTPCVSTNDYLPKIIILETDSI